MSKKNVLSCIQPTGEIHLGNYFGAVRNYVALQEDYNCTYGVVNYHAITMPYDIKKLRENTWDLIFSLLAVGVKAENLFIQSLVPEHAELNWILNCFCAVGRLTNMTQFKDKSLSLGENPKEGFISAGLLDYPVLQVADILIYRADFVPVGKDQAQHLELTREVAQRFNHSVGKEYFVLPETLYTETPSIRSTADPLRKMSKSAGEKHYISLFGDEKRIRKQIKSAVTDTGENSDGGMSPGVANLFEMLKASSGESDEYKQLLEAQENGVLRYGDLKAIAADNVMHLLTPFNEKKKELHSDKRKVKDEIKASSAEIRKRAQETIREVKDLTGLLNVKF
ncbi:MAG: tryptophanyl-tRNA synthetase [Saprospiraceae bacterium]|jgi:tryptophanyl-tRNA synthetase